MTQERAATDSGQSFPHGKDQATRRYAGEELAEALRLHGLWLAGPPAAGRRANLGGADLGGADLRDADLRDADLRNANLRDADLRGANLRGADLRGADLEGADLRDADLEGADLRDADLRDANLRDADLRDANLRRAVLGGADLGGADLGGADLGGADLEGANLPTGETWEAYLAEVVPALLTAGGRTLRQVLDSGAWQCHDWDNCPVAVAFGVRGLDGVPALHRPRAAQFVQLFDNGLIPQPQVQSGL